MEFDGPMYQRAFVKIKGKGDFIIGEGYKMVLFPHIRHRGAFYPPILLHPSILLH